MKTSLQSSTPFPWSNSPAELEVLHGTAALDEAQNLLNGTVCKGESRLPFTPERVGHYAEPLSPLKERDLVALATLFPPDQMLTIEADVNQMLLRLLPEPCWEEDPFEFLSEFLQR
jgi:hypothetical protein